MIGEKEVLNVLENQFNNFLNTIDSYGLSRNTRRDLFLILQTSLSNRITNELNNNRPRNSKTEDVTTTNNEKTSSVFNAAEEQIINQYLGMLQRGENIKQNFLFEQSDRDLEIIREALRRYNETKENEDNNIHKL